MSGCEIGADQVATLSCIFPLVANIVYWALIFVGIIALIIVAISGIKLMSSGGDAKQLDSARKTLTFAIAGLALVFLSFMIVNTIAYITGVGCLNLSHGLPTSFSACR